MKRGDRIRILPGMPGRRPRAHAGCEAVVAKRNGSTLLVTLPDGARVWVPRRACELLKEPASD